MYFNICHSNRKQPLVAVTSILENSDTDTRYAHDTIQKSIRQFLETRIKYDMDIYIISYLYKYL